MNKILFALPFIFLTVSCGQKTVERSGNKDTVIVAQQNPVVVADKNQAEGNSYPDWMDTVITHYVKNSDNELIKQAIKDSTFEEWLLDSEPDATNPRYRFQIGRDVTDEGGMNPRFVTDQWIDIDSATRKVYEYDVANDTLRLWQGSE